MARSRQLPGPSRRAGCRRFRGPGRPRVSSAPVCFCHSSRTVEEAASPHARMVMRKSLGQVEGFVGVDISESWLDVHLLPSGERARFSRDRRGIARLVRWLVGKGRLLVVVEATGGLKRGLRAALAQAGIALAVVNPRQIRDLARAADRLAKTDRLDAWVLALYGERLRPATKCARCSTWRPWWPSGTPQLCASSTTASSPPAKPRSLRSPPPWQARGHPQPQGQHAMARTAISLTSQDSRSRRRAF
jgi:hypothetical protein